MNAQTLQFNWCMVWEELYMTKTKKMKAMKMEEENAKIYIVYIEKNMKEF